MANVKARTVRRVKQDLRRAKSPEIAQSVLKELTPEIDKQVEAVVEGRRPGMKINGNKTPWTEKDLNEMFEIVKFTPVETIPVGYNGVRYQCYAGIEMHVPSVVKEGYDRYMKRKSLPTPPPPGIEVGLGAGGLE